MTQVSLDIEASALSAGDGHCPEVGYASQSPARPRVVLLESGVKALVEVVGLADVNSAVDAVLVRAEEVDAADSLIAGPNGVDEE